MEAPVNAAISSMIHSDVWQALRLDVQQYMYTTGALKAATGFCIGMATKEGIDRILAVSIHPMLLLISERLSTWLKHTKRGGFASNKVVQKALHILGVVSRTLLEWIILVGVAYFALELVFGRRIIGLSSSVVPGNKQNDFITAQVDDTKSLPHGLGQS